MDSAIDVQSNLEYLLLEVGIVPIDLVDHCLLIGECLNRLNAFIYHLIALFNLLEQKQCLVALVAPEITLSDEGVDESLETTLDRGL